MWPKQLGADKAPPQFKLVLFRPEIPGNTGSIGRTCVALNIPLILIKPYGFDLSEKSVRRAGLDYWKYLNITEFDSWEDFLESLNLKAENSENSINNLWAFTRFAEKTLFENKFDFALNSNNQSRSHYLIFGAESKGLPDYVTKSLPIDQHLALPMFSPHLRSLNLANAATAVMYEAVRQQYYSC